MKNNKLIFCGLANSVCVLIYISAVAWLLQNGEKIFGKMQNFWGPVAFLLLFVFSAAITGALVLGWPIWLFLNDQRKEAVKLFLYTIAWLFIITVVILGVNILI